MGSPAWYPRRTAVRDAILARFFVLPTVGYVIALVAVPVVLSVTYALSDVTIADPRYDWVGAANFAAALHDRVFWRAATNTLVFTTLTTLVAVVAGNVVARLLLAKVFGRWVVRMCVLLPWTTPVTLSSVSWLWLLDPVYSPLDWVARQVGLLGAGESVNWLGHPTLAAGCVVAVQAWRLTPLTAVIIMTGLAGIPASVQEAAQMDGAGRWQRAFSITVPLTLPVTAVAALFCAVFSATDMAVVKILTNGGPSDATEVVSTWAFAKGIDGGDLSQGTAIALFLAPVLLAAALALLRAARRVELR
jgi:multiple sugar transport system permease protein